MHPREFCATTERLLSIAKHKLESSSYEDIIEGSAAFVTELILTGGASGAAVSELGSACKIIDSFAKYSLREFKLQNAIHLTQKTIPTKLLAPISSAFNEARKVVQTARKYGRKVTKRSVKIVGRNKKTPGSFSHPVKQVTKKSKLPNQGPIYSKVKGELPVNIGKHGKHVPGHNNYIPSRSSWDVGEDGIKLTQEAWRKGKFVKDRKNIIKKYTTKDGRTIRVHKDENGWIHGYPVPKP